MDSAIKTPIAYPPWVIYFNRDGENLPVICESVTILRGPPLDTEVEMVIAGSTWIAEGDSCRFAIGGGESFNLSVIRATIEYEKQTLRLGPCAPPLEPTKIKPL